MYRAENRSSFGARDCTPEVHSVLSDASSPDPLNDSLSDPRSFIATSPIRRMASHTEDHVNSYSNPKTVSPMRRATSSTLNYPPPSSVSPSKTVTEQTLSPWRIRVTVEAEPEDAELTGRMQTITRTTTIPLRSGSSPVHTGHSTNTSRTATSGSRTRSVTGSSSPVKTRQRSSTPNSGRRRRQSVTDLDIVVLGDDADEDEWSRTSRKQSPARSRRRSSKLGRAPRGISSLMDDFEVVQDSEGPDNNHGSETLHSVSPQLRQIDLNKVSVRPRGNSFKQKSLMLFEADQPLPSKENVETYSETGVSGGRKVSVNSTRSYPTPSPTPSESDPVADPVPEADHVEGFDTVMESEGFTMIDLDSIPSVQQLRSSPLNTSDPPTTAGSSQSAQAIETDKLEKSAFPTPGKPFPSYLHLAEGESDISSALPSSPPLSVHLSKQRQSPATNALKIPSSTIASRQRQVTPQIYSSPRLPSPPRPTQASGRTPPDSSKALKAGITLQSAIQPRSTSVSSNESRLTVSTPFKEQNQSGHPDALFEGFDSGAQRELRAGLRFGEELAKRQNASADDTVTISAFPLPSHVPVERREQMLQRKAFPSRLVNANEAAPSRHVPIRKSSMLSHMTFASDESMHDASHASKFDEGQDGQEASTSHRERLWQQEREEVIRQAQITDPNKVITVEDEPGNVIDDTNEINIQDVTMQDDDSDDADIWLAEAKHASSSPRLVAEQSISHGRSDEPQRPSNHREVSPKLARGLPAKPNQQGGRAGDDGGSTSFLTNGDGDTSMSGVIWHAQQDQDSDVRFGAGQLRNTRRELRQSVGPVSGDRRSSGTFDLGKMIATPQRTRGSLEEHENGVQAHEAKKQFPINSGGAVVGVDDCAFDVEESSIADQPIRVPVNFNDTASSVADTPPMKLRVSLSPSKQRPSTPRSAIRTFRQTLGTDEEPDVVDSSEPSSKRVVWARKSNHMNEEWIESSRSVISESSSIQKETPTKSHAQLQEVSQELEESDTRPNELRQPPQSSQARGWLGWLRGEVSAADVAVVSDGHSAGNLAVTDGPSDVKDIADPKDRLCEELSQWSITAKNPGINTEQSSGTSTERRSKIPMTKLPTYLLPPSYPTDPKRPSAATMATSGQFTNTHFRTLHIIYAKSSRPRFHAPQIEECRPEIRELVTDKWRLYIDEDRTGLGGFEFKFGEKEGRVVERFCREVEWGYLIDRHANGKLPLSDLMDVDCIWGGAGHGQCDVKWEWSCEQLAQWLGRIVVGEVVRDEEYGGRR